MKKQIAIKIFIFLLCVCTQQIFSTCCLTSGSILYSYYQTDYFWNHSGKKMSSHNRFERNQVDLQVFYPVTLNDFVQAEGNYNVIHEKVNGSTRGFGDVELSWQRFLGYKYSHHLFAQLIGIVPVGPAKAALRFGRWGTEINLLASRSFYFRGRASFYYLRAGYRAYQGFPSDQVRADALFGCQVSSRVYLEASAACEYGLFNGKKGPFHNLILFNPNYRLIKAYMVGVYSMYKNAYLSLGVFKHLWGRNVGTGGGVMGGAWMVY